MRSGVVLQRWATATDDETVALRERVAAIGKSHPVRPPWWRPYARRQWLQVVRDVEKWAHKNWDLPGMEPYR